MSTQTILGHSFPTPCKRCGGALYRQVDYCPYCGAVHPLDAGPHKRVVIPGSRASAMSKAAQKNGFEPAPPADTDLTASPMHADEPAPAEIRMHLPARVAPDIPMADLAAEAPQPEGRAKPPFRRALFAVAAVVAIGLAIVGYALFSDDGESQSGNAEQVADGTQDARTTTGTIAPYTPAQSAPPVAAVKPTVAANPANPVNIAKPAPAIPATPVAPQVAPAPVKPVAPQFRDAGQAVQAARTAFRANDLSAAQAALGAAQTLQPDNADVQSLLAELKPLAARRDTALQAAQACAAQQSWSCARQHANEALAIDTGNETAKTILERVIRETGWAPLNSHAAPGGPPQARTQTQAQLQTSLSQGMPANGGALPATPRTATAAAPGSVEARERAIKDSGWTRGSANGAKPATGTPSGQ